jgi:replication factor C subunit 3/5
MSDTASAPTLNKGKGKATELNPVGESALLDEDNLPWSVRSNFVISLYVFWSEYIVLYDRVEKYRPVTLDDVVSHQDITSTRTLSHVHTTPNRICSFIRLFLLIIIRHAVENFILKNRLPHLLFYGPPGTGKTSTILAMARRIYGADYKKQILEVCLCSCFCILHTSTSKLESIFCLCTSTFLPSTCLPC